MKIIYALISVYLFPGSYGMEDGRLYKYTGQARFSHLKMVVDGILDGNRAGAHDVLSAPIPCITKTTI